MSPRARFPNFCVIHLFDELRVPLTFSYLCGSNPFFSGTGQLQKDNRTGQNRPEHNIRTLGRGADNGRENSRFVFEINLNLPVIGIIKKTSSHCGCGELFGLTFTHETDVKILLRYLGKDERFTAVENRKNIFNMMFDVHEHRVVPPSVATLFKGVLTVDQDMMQGALHRPTELAGS